MNQCGSCGKDNRDGAGFCRHCGQPMQFEDNGGEQTTDLEGMDPPLDEATIQLLPQEDPANTHIADEDAPTLVENRIPEKIFDGIPTHPDQIEPQAEFLEHEEGQDLEHQNPVNGENSDEDAVPVDDVPVGNAPTGNVLPGDVKTESETEDDAELERPLSPGVLILERYRVLAVVSDGDPDNIYEVEDLLLCWNCGYVNQIVDDIYCWDCGAALEQKMIVQLRETPLKVIDEGAEASETGFDDGGYRYEPVMSQEEDREPLPTAFQMSIGFQSDAGELREVDEDSLLVLQANALCELQGVPSLGFFAVADGIGGHQAGEIASRSVIQSLAANVLETIFAPEISGDSHSQEALKSLLKAAVISANQDLLATRQSESKDMGCTLTSVLVRDNQAIIINVGDSRTYLMRMGALSQITEDHSMVAKLLAQGLIEPGEAFTHEQKSVIYRSMGDNQELELDDAIFELHLEPGDRLLLCCDGLWEMMPDRFMEDLLLEYFDPQAACDRLVEMANQAGGEDNISLIILNFQALKRFR